MLALSLVIFLLVLSYSRQDSEHSEDLNLPDALNNDTQEEESLGKYFEGNGVSRTVPQNTDPETNAPNCILDGVLMQVGTASGDTVCVGNELINTPTPLSTR
jgi:hypothetical protein